MITTVIGSVWLVFFKDVIQGVCNDEASCLRFQREWIESRNLPDPHATRLSFKFIKHDILKITQRKPKKISTN